MNRANSPGPCHGLSERPVSQSYNPQHPPPSRLASPQPPNTSAFRRDSITRRKQIEKDCEDDAVQGEWMEKDSEDKATQKEQIERNGDDLDKEDIIIAVMGVTGAGKSTFVSLLSGEHIEIGHGLQSCTTKVGVYYFMLDGVRVWLIDTPGFDDTNRSDSAVLKDVAYWLASAYTKKIRLAGIIYLHRITDIKMQGSALRNLRMFMQLCGPNNLESVILATTHWTNEEGKSVSESVGQARIKELEETEEFWGGMITRGSRVEKHDGSRTSARKIVSDLVNRQIRVTLDIQRQLVDEHRNLYDTDAGQALQRELIEERKRSEAKLAELKLDMDFALQEKDKKWQEQIQQDRADFEAKIRKGYTETEELKIDMKKIEKERDAQIQNIQRKWDEDRTSLFTQLERAMREIEGFRSAQRRRVSSPVRWVSSPVQQMSSPVERVSSPVQRVQERGVVQYPIASTSQRRYGDLAEYGIELELQKRLQREQQLENRLLRLVEKKEDLEERILRAQEALRAAAEQSSRLRYREYERMARDELETRLQRQLKDRLLQLAEEKEDLEERILREQNALRTAAEQNQRISKLVQEIRNLESRFQRELEGERFSR